MRDNDRLAEIERRVPRVCFEEDGTTSAAGVVMLRPSDYDWLIARIRALSAQAARDAKAREAGASLREAVRNISVHVRYIETEESYLKHSGWNELRDAVQGYDAALAAREQGVNGGNPAK